MNKAKFVMLIFALAAILSMVCIGYAIALKSILGAIGAIILLGIVMVMGFKMKRKFRTKGLL